jgi:magnesium transporter
MSGLEIKNTDKLKIQKHNNVTWIDVQHLDRETFDSLQHEYKLHPVHLHESTQKVQHTQVEHEADYLFLVLHFPVLNKRTDRITIGQVGIFLGKHYLITIRTAESPAIHELFTACEQDENNEQYFKQGSSYVLYVLINKLLASISEMTERVENELDEIEGLVFDNRGSDAHVIGLLRQKITRLSRVIGPKRLILDDLAQQVDEVTGHSMHKYYASNTKTVNKLWEMIEEAKETIEIYKDADFTTSTEHTNEILAVLTLLFTFTIPVTVMGTLYGMNVPLPGGIQEGAWTFLGPYTTFSVLIVASILMALAMFLYFKSKKWF